MDVLPRDGNAGEGGITRVFAVFVPIVVFRRFASQLPADAALVVAGLDSFEIIAPKGGNGVGAGENDMPEFIDAAEVESFSTVGVGCGMFTASSRGLLVEAVLSPDGPATCVSSSSSTRSKMPFSIIEDARDVAKSLEGKFCRVGIGDSDRDEFVALVPCARRYFLAIDPHD